jgi:hypothetical protein
MRKGDPPPPLSQTSGKLGERPIVLEKDKAARQRVS